MTLLKGCWLSKIDIDKSNEEITIAFYMFNELFNQ